MMLLALLLAASRVLLVNDPIAVPAGEWRALELKLQQRAGRVECSFKVLSRGSGVRVMLMTMRDLQRLRDKSPYSVLDGTPYLREGSFLYKVPRPGDYVIVIDNRFEGRGPATVHLKVAIDHTNEPVIIPRYAPPRTRAIVVALSTLFLLTVFTYFAKRFAG
jgi:hypothetical protein